MQVDWFGRAKCDVEFIGVENNGEINAEVGHAAGLGGQIQNKDDEISKLYIENCNNNGNVSQNGDNPYYSCAGLIANVENDTQIYNSSNYGTIATNGNSVAGIVGTSASDKITIDQCANEGDLQINTEEGRKETCSNAGGILAKNILYKDINQDLHNIENENAQTIITSCTNIGNIKGNNHTGGIVGYTTVKKVKITESKTENCNISTYDGDLGGIVGNLVVEDTTVDNCVVNNSILESDKGVTYSSSYGNTGSIIGNSDISAWKSIDSLNITINNCKADNVEIYSRKDTGGIIGKIGENNHTERIDKNAKILNCSFINGLVDVQDVSYGTYGQSGGIIGCVMGLDNIIISNCNVEGSNISVAPFTERNTSDENVAGICAQISSTNNIVITQCTLKTTDIISDSFADGDANTAGIIAYTEAPSVKIEQGIVENVNMTVRSGNAGGIIGNAMCNSSSNNSDSKLSINYCNVNELNVQSNALPGWGGSNNPNVSGTASVTAGILAISQVYNNAIQNCTVINSSMSGKGENTSGAIGTLFGTSNIDNIQLDNVEVISETTTVDASSNSITAGILCTATNGNGTTLNDGIVKNSKIQGKGMAISGIVGTVQGQTINITNCELNNTEIEDLYLGSQDRIDYTSRAGILATSYSRGISVENCRVINKSHIKSKGMTTAGIIGFAGDLNNIKDCSIEDSIVESGSEFNTGGNGTVAGIVGDVDNIDNPIIDGCSVKNVNISSSSDNIGGIIGTKSGKLSINNSKVENVTMTHTNEVKPKASDNARSIGALVGVDSYGNTTIDSTVLKNCTIDISSGAGYLHAGGIIGFNNHDIVINEENEINGLTINNNTTGGTGGIIGIQTNGSLSIENLKDYNDINITGGQGNCGGIVGLVLDVSVNGLTGNNITVNGTYNSGGLIGIATTGNEVNVSDVQLSNIKVTGTDQVGGLIGIVVNPRLNNVTLTDITVTNNGTGNANTGGLIGISTKEGHISDSTVVSSAEFSKIVINKSSTGTNKITGAPTHTGILLGFGKAITDDVNISDVTIDGTKSQTVGTIGMADTGSDVKNITLNNVNTIAGSSGGNIAGNSKEGITGCTINNSTLIAKGSSEAGGIVGIIGDSGKTISNCNITDSTITGTNGKLGGIVGFTKSIISNCIVTNCEVTSTGTSVQGVGGIAGYNANYGSGTANIINCEVNNSTITAVGGYVGGISGFSDNVISDCTIADSNISSTGSSSVGVGGIVGHGANIIGVDTYIKNCNVLDSNITGNNMVGGISGGAVAKIERCYVGGKTGETFTEGEYAVKIKGNTNVGGIIGDAGIITADNYIMITMLGTNIANSIIEGITNVDYLIGLHNRFSESYTTGTQVETITSSKYTDCELNILTE